MQFSTEINDQLLRKTITKKQVLNQLSQFEKGIPYIQLVRPCLLNNGITRLDNKELLFYKEKYADISKTISIIKFVPASGAATRMFKHLFEYNGKEKSDLLIEFFNKIDQMPFFSLLKKQFPELSEMIRGKKYQIIIDYLLNSLSFSTLPKGAIPFHNYGGNDLRTAFEEHLYESIDYCIGKNDEINLHFTINTDFQDKIDVLLSDKIKCSLNKTFNIKYSAQQSNTDTIAVDLENNPIIGADGELVFRPGGHGALINNLNNLTTDLIFIKNIDNVVTDSKREETIIYKEALAGLALEIKSLRDDTLLAIEGENKIDESKLNKLFSLLEIKTIPANFEDIYSILNRPIRVCGMVKNQGEPGGGPFWVLDTNNNVSKQIVEKSQINLNQKNQKEIAENASHFNPVDLICITINHLGEQYDLLEYIDSNTGFIAEKSIQGEKIKALELPGLWNGAMAKWNTVFVEVPLETFNPVKTVNDLLREVHQPSTS